MRSRKQQITEEIKLSEQEKIRTLWEEEKYKYQVILEAETIQKANMKEITKKRYLRWMRKLETKLSSWNLIEGKKTVQILGAIRRKVGEITLTNWHVNKNANDDA